MLTKYKKAICFVSPFAYPLLSKNHEGSSGGAERQFFLFGRELHKKGWNVSFVTHKPKNTNLNEKTILPVYAANFSHMGGPKWRIIPDCLSLWRSMNKANCYYYVLKNPGHILPVMGLFCKLNRRKLVFWSQMSRDAIRVKAGVNLIVSKLHDLGLRMVDIVIAQTEEQRRNYETNYGIKAVVVPSICESLLLKVNKEIYSNNDNKNIDILWVGNSAAKKRQEIFFELAKLLPERIFAIALNLSDKKRFEKAKNEAQKIPNIYFLGTVPPVEMEHWFSRTKLLINTSMIEGFPNSFLQAWMNGVPVVSLNIDPDHIISVHNLGYLISDQNSLEKKGDDYPELARLMTGPVEKLLNNESLRIDIGEKALKYVKDNHSSEVVVPHLINALLKK
jgi:glycosyltransferase involved in cell wall biosynthesis